MIKISVITICFNNLTEVIETVQSVDKQTLPPYEHVIIDGSTNTEIADHFAKHSTDFRTCITERDNGIADAFNKGVKFASGDILVMLNSGDTFYDADVLETVDRIFQDQPDLQWLHGKYRYFRGGKWVTLGKPYTIDKIYRGMRVLCHQSMFVRKTLHERYGYYDEQYKVAMDYDFVVRIIEEPHLFIDKTVAQMAAGDISAQADRRGIEEQIAILKKRLPSEVLKARLWAARLFLLKKIVKIPFIGPLLFKIKAGLGFENA